MRQRLTEQDTPVSGSRIRPEIQALRALAVLLVVINHLWPRALPGGFVGVDVFFVISGFLTTGHLLREIQHTGTIRPAAFWARRIRRLLPASFLVLCVTLALVLAFVPVVAWREHLAQIVASALSVQNWYLAVTAVDYFAAEDAIGAVQHYWSLSVEEQFYLGWPLLLVLTALVLRRGPARRADPGRRAGRSLLVVSLTIGALSFVVSAVQSWGPQADLAYFSTATRAWEFMVGAALAALPASRVIAPSMTASVAIVLGWVGVVSIGASAVLLTGGTPYPGFAALLPVLGTALVIAGGAPVSRVSIAPIATWRPVRFVGDISYSLYLWHWPLIVVAPSALLTVGGFTPTAKIVVLVVSIVLAALTRRCVEVPFLSRRSEGRASWRVFLLPVVGSALMLAAVVGITVVHITPTLVAQAERVSAAREAGCLGASAIDNGCPDPFGEKDTVDPLSASTDRVVVCDESIGGRASSGSGPSCEYGDTGTRPVIAVIGDSHAQIVSHYVARWANEHGYAVKEYASGACAGLTVTPLRFPNDIPATSADDPESWEQCRSRSAAVLAEVSEDASVRAVILTNSTRSYADAADPGRSALTHEAVAEAISRLSGDGRSVLVVRDVPGLDFAQGGAPECVAVHRGELGECSAPRSVVLPADDPMMLAAEATRVQTLDLSHEFCDGLSCHAVVGGLIAYWDRAHLSASMADTLAPHIDEALAELLPSVEPQAGGRGE